MDDNIILKMTESESKQKQMNGFPYFETFPEKIKRDCFVFFQQSIHEWLKNKYPFFVGRTSGIESAIVGWFLLYHSNDNKQYHPLLCLFMTAMFTLQFYLLRYHCGIRVNTTEDVFEYVRLYSASTVYISDILAIWDGGMFDQGRNLYMYCNMTVPDKRTMPAPCLEPFYFMWKDKEQKILNPDYHFPDLFINKKILIITSHGSSVRYQMNKKNLDKIFAPSCIFVPSQDMIVYKTNPQNGINGDKESWRFHYEKMCRDISDIDFDVAFISCGGFSNLLGMFIKTNLKKNAINVGGSLQLYFGILGKRWFTNKDIITIFLRNQKSWIRALPEDYNNKIIVLENGCYW